LSKEQRNILWDVAKKKCFDLQYNITSEDKNSGNIICQTLVGSATWTMSVQISESGFKVTHQSNELMDSLNTYLAKRKGDMEATLTNALKAEDTSTLSQNKRNTQETQSMQNSDAQVNYVLKAQERLIELGYDPGTPDGVSGPKTKNAITQYQKDMGLLPTGELNPATINSLKIK
jgi:hypothetical protein